MHKHDAYLTQQLNGVAPLSAAEVAARDVLLNDAIKSVGFFPWEEYDGTEKAHVRYTELAEKSVMLDRTELLPVIHACKNAIEIEAPLLRCSLPNSHVSRFAMYPFRFGAGLKYYNDTYDNTKQDLAHTDAKIAKLSHILASSATRTLTLNDLDRKPTVGETVPFKRPVDRIDLVVRLAELKLDRQNTIEYLNTNFAARSRDLR